MNEFIVVSHIFFIMSGALACMLFVKECCLVCRPLCESNRHSDATCASENDIEYEQV
jgi:hypothetical protein